MDKKGRIEELSAMIIRLKGDRSIRQMSRDTDVSASCISALIKGKHLVSPEIIVKITDPKSNPQGGITLERMMRMAGFQRSEESKVNGREESLNNQQFNSLKKQTKEFTGIIISGLIESDNLFNLNKKELDKKEFDLVVEVNGQNWYFDYWIYSEEKSDSFNKADICKRIGRLALMKPDENRKISIVTNDYFTANYLLNNSLISYKGDLSIIFINKKNEIQGEGYISFYDKEHKKTQYKIKNNKRAKEK